jgi:hypothetical protein
MCACVSQVCVPAVCMCLQMKHDLSTYYGYNSYLLDQLTSLFPPGEVLELLEACETPRPVSARVCVCVCGGGGGGRGCRGVGCGVKDVTAATAAWLKGWPVMLLLLSVGATCRGGSPFTTLPAGCLRNVGLKARRPLSVRLSHSISPARLVLLPHAADHAACQQPQGAPA